jgi:hypothetical protein
VLHGQPLSSKLTRRTSSQYLSALSCSTSPWDIEVCVLHYRACDMRLLARLCEPCGCLAKWSERRIGTPATRVWILGRDGLYTFGCIPPALWAFLGWICALYKSYHLILIIWFAQFALPTTLIASGLIFTQESWVRNSLSVSNWFDALAAISISISEHFLDGYVRYIKVIIWFW